MIPDTPGLISSLKGKYLNKTTKEITFFMVSFYLVGLAGTILPFTRQLFLLIFPFAILLSFAVLLLYPEEPLRRKAWILMVIVALSGFLIEVAGVATGKIFGNYTYGSTLGLKLFRTPLMIGINWALLVFASASVAERLKVNMLFKITGASALMVVYDIFLEITAGRLNMWYWDENKVPFRNYVAWFSIAVMMHTLLKAAGIRPVFRSDIPVLASQIVYFIILSVWFTFGG